MWINETAGKKLAGQNLALLPCSAAKYTMGKRKQDGNNAEKIWWYKCGSKRDWSQNLQIACKYQPWQEIKQNMLASTSQKPPGYTNLALICTVGTIQHWNLLKFWLDRSFVYDESNKHRRLQAKQWPAPFMIVMLFWTLLGNRAWPRVGWLAYQHKANWTLLSFLS